MINGNGVSMAEINLNEEQLKNMDTERLQVMVGLSLIHI